MIGIKKFNFNKNNKKEKKGEEKIEKINLKKNNNFKHTIKLPKKKVKYSNPPKKNKKIVINNIINMNNNIFSPNSKDIIKPMNKKEIKRIKEIMKFNEQ